MNIRFWEKIRKLDKEVEELKGIRDSLEQQLEVVQNENLNLIDDNHELMLENDELKNKYNELYKKFESAKEILRRGGYNIKK